MHNILSVTWLPAPYCAAIFATIIIGFYVMQSILTSEEFRKRFENQSYTLEGKEGIRTSIDVKDGPLLEYFDPRLTTIQQLLTEAVRVAGNKEFLGWHKLPQEPYNWLTFSEVYDQVLAFGSYITQNMSKKTNPIRAVGIYSINCPEWCISLFACCCYKMTAVPLYDTLGEEAMRHIMRQTEVSVCVVDTVARARKLLAEKSKFPFLERIVIVKPDGQLQQLQEEAGDSVEVISFDMVVAAGGKAIKKTRTSKSEDNIVICYTSGTTGLPKGVMITNLMMCSGVAGCLQRVGEDIFQCVDKHLSYLPLAHIYEQLNLSLFLTIRGKIGFFSGDPRTLLQDAKTLKPVLFAAVPRVLYRIYEATYAKVSGSAWKLRLLDFAVESKLRELDRNVYRKTSLWDRLIFSKIRAELGGNVQLVLSGGAPLSRDVLRFCRAAFSCPIVEGYGQTETAGAVTGAVGSDKEGGHVGCPMSSARIKLVDIPDMGIVAARDNKGEVCIQGPCCTKGYYKEPELTAQLIDKDGWLHTGDVGIWTQGNSLKLVDRCKHIFKLSQGEYVAPEKVESVYLKSKFVSQVFVDGNPLQAYPVAVVVPEPVALAHALDFRLSVSEANSASANKNGSAGKHNGSGPSTQQNIEAAQAQLLQQVCGNSQAKNIIFRDFARLAKNSDLKGFEQVKSIYLSSTVFGVDNGMLTPTLKSSRVVIRRFFADQIDEMYNKGQMT